MALEFLVFSLGILPMAESVEARVYFRTKERPEIRFDKLASNSDTALTQKRPRLITANLSVGGAK